MKGVHPVLGEVGRYRVQSRSNASENHLVCIVDNQCGCADYVCRRVAHERLTGMPYRCVHLKLARHFALESYIQTMREHLAR